ncbi:MAG: hydrogenase maturation protease [Thermoanaerobaculia bacterium]
MGRVLVFGYGNTLRGDDGVGWRVAEVLSASGLPSEIEVRTLHQLSPELAEPISRADAVLFVDATHVGVPGQVACTDVFAQADRAGFTHHFTPASMLELAREMYGRAPRGVVISICGEAFDLAETFSPRVDEAFPQIVAVVSAKARELAAR